MADKYKNFAELRSSEREGVDFKVTCVRRGSAVAVIAPHGGKIEPGASKIAAAIAGGAHNLYRFEGRKKAGNSSLHITSANFDEPRCLELVRACDQVVAVHGLDGGRKSVEVGGRDEQLRAAVCGNLVSAGFLAKVVTTGELSGTNPSNICNKGKRGVGVQLEISRGLRDALVSDGELLDAFAAAVRQAMDRRVDEKAG